MANETTFLQEDQPDPLSILRKQLTISLKFHHSTTLEKLSKENAIQAMQEVWYSCHPEAVNEVQNPTSSDATPYNAQENTIYL